MDALSWVCKTTFVHVAFFNFLLKNVHIWFEVVTFENIESLLYMLHSFNFLLKNVNIWLEVVSFKNIESTLEIITLANFNAKRFAEHWRTIDKFRCLRKEIEKLVEMFWQDGSFQIDLGRMQLNVYESICPKWSLLDGPNCLVVLNVCG